MKEDQHLICYDFARTQKKLLDFRLASRRSSLCSIEKVSDAMKNVGYIEKYANRQGATSTRSLQMKRELDRNVQCTPKCLTPVN